MDLDVPLVAALAAGALSFLSPCVLPLVPPYLGFLGGVTLDQLAGDGMTASDPRVRGRVFASALAFVLGFATVFVTLGASASSVGALVIAHSDWLARAAGAVLVAFGLHVVGAFRLALLERDARVRIARRPPGLAGAYLVGLAFAFGWSPCVGPVLAAILTLAALDESAARGALLLGAYALGIGLPFLAAALLMRPFLGAMRRLGPHRRAIELAIGGLLIATGVLVFLGTFTAIGFWLLQAFPALGRIG